MENILSQIDEAISLNKPSISIEVPRTEVFKTFIGLCEKGFNPQIEEQNGKNLISIELKTQIIHYEKAWEINSKRKKVLSKVGNLIEVNFKKQTGEQHESN